MVYLPATDGPSPVHVNFHGGGYVLPLTELDDPLCRYLAAEAGVTVVNVDYVVAPQHPFPAAPHQAYEVVRWVAEHGAEQGWDGDRLTIGGQSAGGALAAAVARLALERGGPADRAAGPALPTARPRDERQGQVAQSPTDRCCDPGWRRSSTAPTFPTLDSARTAWSPPPTRPTPPTSPASPRRWSSRPSSTCSATKGTVTPNGFGTPGALVQHHVVPGADHAYDGDDDDLAREVYALIAEKVRAAVG